MRHRLQLDAALIAFIILFLLGLSSHQITMVQVDVSAHQSHAQYDHKETAPCRATDGAGACCPMSHCLVDLPSNNRGIPTITASSLVAHGRPEVWSQLLPAMLERPPKSA